MSYLALLLLLAVVVEGRYRNVLLITVDDLRPQLGPYGLSETHTPNIDKLGTDAVTFKRAYCQMAVCSPSRNSFMTGRRPDTTKVWNFVDDFRRGPGANWTTMPQYFKENGYLTYGAGKLFHPNAPPNNDFPQSWTVDDHNSFYWGNGAPIGDAGGCDGDTITPLMKVWGSGAVCQDLNDEAAMNDHDNKTQPQTQQEVEYDHRVATRTIESMTQAKEQGRNFFVAAGLRRPHLGWRTPQRFYDLYENATLSVAKHQTIGDNITLLAFEMNGLMNEVYTGGYVESPNGPPLPDTLQRELRRGYYAAVSFLDFEVGRILDSLDRLGLAESTAVVLHGDHGWKLGEHGAWSKCTNWEVDARVPLLIRAPWVAGSAGTKTLAFAELVDLFPTLVDLAGLPEVSASEGLEGTSLVPVLQAPESDAPHNKSMAFSQYPRCPQYDMYEEPEKWECLEIPVKNISRMGYSVRTEDFRYTQWRVWRPDCSADWASAGLVAEELYDHTGDTGLGSESFDEFEYVNLAYDAARKAEVQKLAAVLQAQFDHGQQC